MSIRVIIVEDDLRFLEGLGALLKDSPSIELIGRYSRGEGLNKEILDKKPDVVLIDLGLPDIPGEEIIKEAVEGGCKSEFLVLTVYDDDRHLIPALKAGAVGYIVKDEVSFSEIVDAIHEIINGGAPMSRGIAKRLLEEFRDKDDGKKIEKIEALSKREMEILEMLSNGFCAKKVGEKLFISYQTVRSHQKNIYKKLHVNSLVEAVILFKNK